MGQSVRLLRRRRRQEADQRTLRKCWGKQRREWRRRGGSAPIQIAARAPWRPFGGGGGPFGGGGGPFGGGNQPDLDRLIAQAQGYIRSLLGGGSGRGSGGRGFGGFANSRGLVLLLLAVVVLWVGSGFYRVQPDEQGVVLRFGAYSY